MDTVKLIAFNNMFSQFCNMLIESFPSEKSLHVYKMQIDIATSANPMLVRQLFTKYVAIHSDEIHNCNEQFLLNKIGENDSKYFIDFNSIWYKDENTIMVKAKIFQCLKRMLKLC